MRVAVYTLTRDRLEFTKHCFASLWEKAGYAFDHWVLDNGSQDGTREWLGEQMQAGRISRLMFCETNTGISKGSNAILEALAESERKGGPLYDLVVKVDNDCELATDDVLAKLVDCFKDRARYRFGGEIALSPTVDGIVNQPHRLSHFGVGGYRVGQVGIIGGLFQAVPWRVYRAYRFPETLPLARGQDDHFCDWMIHQGVTLGYVEGVVVRHYLSTDGQAQAMPWYFERKRVEERGIAP